MRSLLSEKRNYISTAIDEAVTYLNPVASAQ